MNRDLSGRPIDDVAIDLLRQYEREALARHPEGYWVSYSGGKDSVVVLDLARRAGVRHAAYHALTTVDAPELVRFVRATPGVTILRPQHTMWQLIRELGPPTRRRRWCCARLKERFAAGRAVVTGVRWAESPRRAKRPQVNEYRGQLIVSPIIEWTTLEVWQYIRERGLAYCALYDEGFRRLGCVGCPMTSGAQLRREFARWPRIAAAWERAVKAWCPGPSRWWTTPDECWQWWCDRNRMAVRTRSGTEDLDCVLFEPETQEEEQP